MKMKHCEAEERDGAFTNWSLRSGAAKKAKRQRNKSLRREVKFMLKDEKYEDLL